jgi:hypothetical protein
MDGDAVPGGEITDSRAVRTGHIERAFMCPDDRTGLVQQCPESG